MNERSGDKSLPLNCDPDAQRWAREFMALMDKGASIDEGLMIAWFANAIMCGVDTQRWKQEALARPHVGPTCISNVCEDPIGCAQNRGCRKEIGYAPLREEAPPSSTRLNDLSPFQGRVAPFMEHCFGPEISADTVERYHRFIEESLELAQALGCEAQDAHMLVDYVFNRPVGQPHQEVGGVMVTLAALCLAAGLDMHVAGEDELRRVWGKIDVIREKQKNKPKGSPLPQYADRPVVSSATLATTPDGWVRYKDNGASTFLEGADMPEPKVYGSGWIALYRASAATDGGAKT